MTVRAILDSKGHHIESVEPEARLSAAIRILSERRIGAVLVMQKERIEGILSERDIVRVLGERGASVLWLRTGPLADEGKEGTADAPGFCGSPLRSGYSSS